MSNPTAREVLKLYRDILKYGRQLQFTDKNYFCQRIRNEFKAGKDLKNQEDINFHFQEEKMSFLIRAASQNIVLMSNLPSRLNPPVRQKQTLDYSRVPILNEDDLEEKFVRGSGPGGQAVNKTNNCVVLLHKPSGIVVKCHNSRLQAENRRLARELMIQRLDSVLNKEHSIEAQKKDILERKRMKREQRKKEMAELKEKWKEVEGLNKKM
ncbi:hypothetical protein C0J52_08800 [Blattella germanica]|nr:hypothetical protein C0J52_08800 [Blattella germanica]